MESYFPGKSERNAIALKYFFELERDFGIGRPKNRLHGKMDLYWRPKVRPAVPSLDQSVILDELDEMRYGPGIHNNIGSGYYNLPQSIILISWSDQNSLRIEENEEKKTFLFRGEEGTKDVLSISSNCFQTVS